MLETWIHQTIKSDENNSSFYYFLKLQSLKDHINKKLILFQYAAFLGFFTLNQESVHNSYKEWKNLSLPKNNFCNSYFCNSIRFDRRPAVSLKSSNY